MVAALHSLPLSPVHLSIDSDQEVATAVLREIAMVCRVHGAEWHPQLTAEVSGGAMRLLAPPGTEGPGGTILAAAARRQGAILQEVMG